MSELISMTEAQQPALRSSARTSSEARDSVGVSKKANTDASRLWKGEVRSFFILKFGLKGAPLTINRPQMRPQNGGCMESEEKRTKNGDSMQKYCFLQLF